MGGEMDGEMGGDGILHSDEFLKEDFLYFIVLKAENLQLDATVIVLV